MRALYQLRGKCAAWHYMSLQPPLQGVRRSATDIHNTRKKSNNREHARVANGMWLWGELLHALSTRSTRLNLYHDGL